MKAIRQKSILAAIVGALLLAFTAGCNTTKGLGKDIERAGEKIQDNAR